MRRIALAGSMALPGLGGIQPVTAQARLTEAQATAIALARVPGGTVKSSELEREAGRLVWSFDIEQPGRAGVREVLVDARSGKVVSVKHETPQQEAGEQRQDAKLAQ